MGKAVWMRSVENWEVRDLSVCSRTNRNNVGGTRYFPDSSSSAVNENKESPYSSRSSAVGGENHIGSFTPRYFQSKSLPNLLKGNEHVIFHAIEFPTISKLKGTCCLTILISSDPSRENRMMNPELDFWELWASEMVLRLLSPISSSHEMLSHLFSENDVVVSNLGLP